MEYKELLPVIIETVLIPLLIALTGFIVKWINAKANQLKEKAADDRYFLYIDILQELVTKAVIMVNQTYVDELKKTNSFSKEAQVEAFRKVYETVMTSLSEDVVVYLQQIISNLDDYITVLIESSVKE
jgi:hypothetical protein